MTAALISSNIGYLLLTFLPPVLWLLFYLREDQRPEPKRLLILTFAGGMLSAVIAIFAECLAIGEAGSGCSGVLSGSITIETSPFLFFLVIGIIEEYVKYLPVRFFILRRPDFDEPVDAMIYMMTAAMGFAALENYLFLIPVFSQEVPTILPSFSEHYLTGLEIIANRFLGANLLHALASGLVGFFLARKFLSPYRHHYIAAGILFAAVLHAGFNYLILIRDSFPQGTLYLIFLLSTMAVMVFVDFERLKQKKINFE